MEPKITQFYVIYDRVTETYLSNNHSWIKSVKPAAKWYESTMVCIFINEHRDDLFSGFVPNLDVIEVTETLTFKNVLNPKSDEDHQELNKNLHGVGFE